MFVAERIRIMQHHDPSQDPDSAPLDLDTTPQRAEETASVPRCEMRDVTVSQANDSPRRYYEF
jgi:hypothetical protein